MFRIKVYFFAFMISMLVGCGSGVDKRDNNTTKADNNKTENEREEQETPVTRYYPQETTLKARITDFNVSAPRIGHPITDLVFGTKIYKVEKEGSSFSPYPKVQAWNVDSSLLRIGNRLYHADTLKETNRTKGQQESVAYATLCSRNGDYFRWSHTRATTFYVLSSNNHFIQATIKDSSVDCSLTLDTFSEYEVVHIGPNEGSSDTQDRYILFSAKKPNDITMYAILFDMQTGQRIWTKTISEDFWVLTKGDWLPKNIDWIAISPSGKYIVLNNDNAGLNGMYRYDINLENKTKLQYKWEGNGQLYSEGGHGDMGYDTDGNEVWVQFISGVGVYSFNLDAPNELGKKLLDSPYGGGHISCQNTKRKGWCYVTTKGEKYQRVFALKLDGTSHETVENFSQTYLPDDVYALGGVNPLGTQVIFNSYWSQTAASFDTFIAEAIAP